jgi:hypothetical protein
MRRYGRFGAFRWLLGAIVTTVGIHCTSAQVFFGEDINTNAPPGQNQVPRGPRTNADAAFAAFIASASSFDPPFYGVEDFESFTPFTSSNFTLHVSFPATSVSGTLLCSGVYGIGVVPSNTTSNGGYPSSGEKCLAVGLGSSTVTLTFSAPVLGVGFYGTDAERYRPVVSLTYEDSTTQDFVVNVTVPTDRSGNIFFWGYKITSSSRITQMTLRWNGGGNDGLVVDDFTVLVPEPASLVALVASLAGFIRLRRRH